MTFSGFWLWLCARWDLNPGLIEMSPAFPFFFFVYPVERQNNSLVSLQMKNPIALILKEVIVKVSTLSQVVR